MKRNITVHLKEFLAIRYGPGQESDAEDKLRRRARDHFAGLYDTVSHHYEITHDHTKHPLRGISRMTARSTYVDVLI